MPITKKSQSLDPEKRCLLLDKPNVSLWSEFIFFSIMSLWSMVNGPWSQLSLSQQSHLCDRGYTVVIALPESRLTSKDFITISIYGIWKSWGGGHIALLTRSSESC
jgi:hypothetical protein